MVLDGVPVVGSFRRAILQVLRAAVVTGWARRVRGHGDAPAPTGVMAPLVAGAAHSSRLVAAAGHAVLGLADTVSRTHDAYLIRFMVLAVSEWLPVERRLEVEGLLGGRAPGCKLCMALGGAPVTETLRHLFVCPSPVVANQLARLVANGLGILREAGVRVAGPSPGSRC